MEKRIAVDASALLATYFNEPAGEWVTDRLADADVRLISPVTITEVLILVRDRFPMRVSDVERQLLGDGLRCVPTDTAHARLAAVARLQFPALNLGDCFVYALAKIENAAVLTLDADFRRCDVPLLMP